MQKIHANELHVHPGEDRTRATAKHLHYRFKETLEFLMTVLWRKSIIKLYIKWQRSVNSIRAK